MSTINPSISWRRDSIGNYLLVVEPERKEVLYTVSTLAGINADIAERVDYETERLWAKRFGPIPSFADLFDPLLR